VITLYAITDHPTPPMPEENGIRVVARGELAAVCGPVVTSEVTADALWEHERLVEALMDDRDLLPVRYGTCLPDDDAAARALEENRAAYASSLRRVRGAVELAVRVFPGDGARPTSPAAARSAGNGVPSPPGADAATTTGTAYLRARARSAAGEAEARARVHEPLARAARAATVARLPRAGELLRAAYLVDRAATAAFSARVRELQERNPGLRITCTGPWPPYSFAGSGS
jgi:hypothetical protein